MTFIHEGNPNYVDKLVNFEKMVREIFTVAEHGYSVIISSLCFWLKMWIFCSPIVAAHDRQNSENSSRMQKPALR